MNTKVPLLVLLAYLIVIIAAFEKREQTTAPDLPTSEKIQAGLTSRPLSHPDAVKVISVRSGVSGPKREVPTNGRRWKLSVDIKNKDNNRRAIIKKAIQALKRKFPNFPKRVAAFGGGYFRITKISDGSWKVSMLSVRPFLQELP